jgi:CheY-like chemotaxis protein
MSKTGPIILVEDDQDDKLIIEEILADLKVTNKLIWFSDSPAALDFLITTREKPFLIICDVNLPTYSGIRLKQRIDNDPQLRKKSIPFMFFSTSVDRATVNEAFTQLTVQGFFQKPAKVTEIRQILEVVITYWRFCRHPNSD